VNSFLIRALSALILAPVVLFAVYNGGLFFQIIMLAALVIALKEWLNMCHVETEGDNQTNWVWFLPGCLYIFLSLISLYWLRISSQSGHITLFWLLAVVWAADTGAYLFGSTIGGPKLSPTISPNKTWAGFIGALISAALVGFITSFIYQENSVNWNLILISIMLGALSQMGDLLESYAKRHFGIKDSGSIIPGHGGVLDRIDGLMAAAMGAGILIYLEMGLNSIWR